MPLINGNSSWFNLGPVKPTRVVSPEKVRIVADRFERANDAKPSFGFGGKFNLDGFGVSRIGTLAADLIHRS